MSQKPSKTHANSRATSEFNVHELKRVGEQLNEQLTLNAELRELASRKASEAALLARQVTAAKQKLAQAGVELELLNRKAKELAQTRLSAVFQNALDGMMTIDANGIVESFNPACERIFGYGADEVIGSHMKMLMPDPEHKGHDRNLFEYLETVKTKIFGMPGREVLSTRKDGSAFMAEMSISTFQLEDGQHFTGIIRDVTARKAAEAQEEQSTIARVESERANLAKSEFLANMSHELRTPLNSILGMTELLEDTSLMAEQQAMLRAVNQSASALLEIVNDILDLSRIEANVMALEPIGIDIVSLIARTIETLKPFASKKNLTLQADYKTKNIPYVLGDPGKIARVFVNLINNAIKYTIEGGVSVEVAYERPSEKTIELLCVISDTGVGIEKDKLEVIFEKFTQVDSSTTRKFGGTGLGLAITKHLAEMMGGSVRADSVFGKGSVFSIMIPLTVTDTLHGEFAKEIKELSHVSSANAISGDNVRILVAEDHTLNQAFIRKVFHKYRIKHFAIVDNGNEVLEAMKKDTFDIILMDCHMPEKNGYEATADIRALERGGNVHIPIVAMTANAMTGDRQKCMLAGMDDYLSKPFGPDKLKSILARWIQFSDTKTGGLTGSEQSDPVDFTNLRSFSDGDVEEERRFVELFVRQNAEALDRLRDNCKDGESAEWVAAAHLAKGGAVSIGATHLSALAEKAQKLVVAAWQERRKQLAEMERETERVRQFLEEQNLLPKHPAAAA